MSTLYSITALACFIAIIFYITDGQLKKYLGNPYFLLVAIGLITRILAAHIDMAFATDMNCFKAWGNMLVTNGFSRFYTSDAFTDYPPAYMYILFILGGIRNLFRLDYNGFGCELLFKFPAILADIGLGLMVYRLALRYTKPKQSFVLSLAFLLNPAVIINSAVWGQVDSVFTIVMAVTVYFLLKDQIALGVILFAIAVLFKPHGLMFTPLVGFCVIHYMYRNKWSKKSFLDVLESGLLFTLTIIILCLPFTPELDISPILNQYINTVESYSYASFNAYNFYSLIGANHAPLDHTFLGIPFFYWGVTFIVLTVAGSLYLLWRNQTRSNVWFTAAFINISVFMFCIKMHERYLFASIPFLLLAYLYNKDKKLLLLFGGFSATLFINCADILYMYHIHGNFNPDMIRQSLPLVSFVNFVLYGFTLYTAFTAFPQTKDSELPDIPPEKINQYEHFTIEASETTTAFTKWDYISLASITLIYGIVAFFNLGNTQSPQSDALLKMGDRVTVDLQQEEQISEIQFMLGARHNKTIDVYYSTDDFVYEPANPLEMQSVFAWKSVEQDFKARYVQFDVMSDETYVQEIGIRNNRGDLLPVTLLTDTGAQLFDEQALVPSLANYKNSSIFDEVYHPRTAYEFIHKLSVYEWTHPPLGKVIISWGIQLFGMTPFGWRFMGTLFGILMVPFIFLFARRMFHSTFWASFAAIIFAFDFMHYTQTRLATIDTYIVFFVILMYYFMYRYYTTSYYDTPLYKTLILLFFSGLSMGLGIACKWPGVYAGAGLAVIFFLTLYKRYKEYRYALYTGQKDIAAKFIPYTWVTLGCCVVFFVAIPVIVYLLSYIPYLQTQGMGAFNSITDNPVIYNQQQMFSYHAFLESSHPYASDWWQWPLMIRPIFYSSATLGTTTFLGMETTIKSGISAFGNPAVWWVGIVGFFYCIRAQILSNHKKTLFLLVAFMAQYLPWMLVTRTTYIYHYFPCVPFLVLIIAYFFKEYVQPKYKNGPFVYLGITVLLFIMFYPVLSGLGVPTWYVDTFLRWLPTWNLI